MADYTEYRDRLAEIGFKVFRGADPDPSGTPPAPDAPPVPTPDEVDPDTELINGIRSRKASGKATEVDLKLLKVLEENASNATKLAALGTTKAERDALQTQLTEIQRKEQTDLQNAQNDLTAATTKIEKLETVLQRALLENAIRNSDAFTWHDVSDVVGSLDTNVVKVDLEAGSVEGLEAELKRVAGAKPHYVKSKKGQKAEQGNQPDQTPQQPSGSHPYNAGGTPSQQQVSKEAKLQEKYGILRTMNKVS